MGIKRDMIRMIAIIHNQGCRITRWKLTDNQAHALAPSKFFYDQMLAGKAQFFSIPVKVIDT